MRGPLETNPYVRGLVIPLACGIAAYAAAYKIVLHLYDRLRK